MFAWATTVTCLPVAAAARGAEPSAARWPLIAGSLWFPLVAWADVAVVATGEWRLLKAVGLAVLLGVLLQTIAAVVAYLAPMLRSRFSAERDLLLVRLGRLGRPRAVAFNAGVAAVAAATMVGRAPGAALARSGWALIGLALAFTAAAGLWPVPAHPRPRAHRPGSEGVVGLAQPSGLVV